MSALAAARAEIENLLFLYAERIDRGDFAGVAELFENGAISVEGTDAVTRGREAVQRLYETTTRRYEDGTPRTRHVTTNVVVELEPDGLQARARSYFTVMQQTPELPLQVIVGGRYHDRFEHVDGRWRFASRHMILDQLGDLSRHLLLDVETVTRRP